MKIRGFLFANLFLLESELLLADCFDSALSLDQLKAITGGVKAAAQTTQATKTLNNQVAATNDEFVGFGDLYGI